MANVVDNGFKQKAVIKFLVLEARAAREISDRLRNVYGESALSYTSVKRWVSRFMSISTDYTDKPCSSRPSTPSQRKMK